MSANIQELAARITTVLRDTGYDSWTLPSIHDAILEAEKTIVIFRPDASAVDREFACVEGIRQSLAALTGPAAYRLLKVKYNLSSEGFPGRSIYLVSEGDLDAMHPDWRSDPVGTAIREFMFDQREPLLFYIYPRVAAGTKCQISYSAVPAAYGVVDENTVTNISDLYAPMIIEFALYRLFGHDTEGSANYARSQQRLANFQAMMGVKVTAEGIFGPKNPEHKR